MSLMKSVSGTETSRVGGKSIAHTLHELVLYGGYPSSLHVLLK